MKRGISLTFEVFLWVLLGVAAVFFLVKFGMNDEAALNSEKIRDIARIEDQSRPYIPEELDDTGEADASPVIVDEEIDYLSMRYDFDALRSINPDIIGWILIPGTVIDYPILQAGEGKDSRHYLKVTPEGKRNSHGSIFIEQGTDAKFLDPISLIYGHNMNDGSMFAGLHKYLDGSFLNDFSDIYIYLPDKTIRYKAFSSMVRGSGYITDEYPDKEELFKYVRDNSKVFNEVAGNERADFLEKRILTLSTCGSGNKRVLVFASEEKRVDIPKL